MQYKVYKLENKTTGKVYIGSTYKYSARISTHFSQLRSNTHYCPDLQADFNAGHEFEASIIDTAPSKREAQEFEKKYIAEYGENCYNIRYNHDNPKAIERTLNFAHRQRMFTLEDALRMKILREKLNMTYHKLADEFNCSPVCIWWYLNRYLSGNTQKRTYVQG